MQIAKFIITDGGTHSPEKWAELTASELVDSAKESDPNAPIRKIENGVIDILSEYYTHVREAEVAGLDTDGDGILESPIDGFEHDPEEIVTKVVALMAGTPFETHSKRQDFQDRIRLVVTRHTVLVKDVERSHWADHNPSDVSAAWHSHRRDHGILAAHQFKQE